MKIKKILRINGNEHFFSALALTNDDDYCIILAKISNVSILNKSCISCDCWAPNPPYFQLPYDYYAAAVIDFTRNEKNNSLYTIIKITNSQSYDDIIKVLECYYERSN